ncbi:hypothetical protein [Actinomadura oligospora]|uniref:hypothetical protein n=1 Tax=Actinomadura oligospora TaxID=111804 RepID=UPI0004B3C20C|nr:hypothetical protein [Actinomadura oligospora]
MAEILYELLARTPDGMRGLAAARLRRGVLNLLHQGLKSSGMTQPSLPSGWASVGRL